MTPPGAAERPSPFVLGVDGGGTRTRCACVGPDGTLLSVAEAGPANYLRVGLEVALDSVRRAAQSAATAGGRALPAEAACLCLAGMGRAEGRELMLPRLEQMGLARRLLADSDAEAALAAAHALGPGVVVIAGTGSIAYGRDPTGRRVRADGWGPVLGDEGSGYWIGREALRAVLRAADGRGPATALTAPVLAALGVTDASALVLRLPVDQTHSAEIAPMAALCSQVARRGDAVARGILAAAGAKLADTAAAAARGLGPEATRGVALTGGVFEDATVRAAFAQALRRALPGATVRAPRFPPAVGAALLAFGAAGWPAEEGVLRELGAGPAALRS